MQNKLYLFLVLILSSCVMKINEGSIDLNSDYEGLISTSSSSVEQGQLVEFELKNLIYALSFKNGVPSIESYGWDFECDGVSDITTSVPYVRFLYSEEGSYTPCININYRVALGMEKYPKIAKIISNNFEGEKIYITKSVADFNISSESTELVAGVLSETNAITIKAIDAEGNIIPHAGIAVSSVNGSSVYYKKGSVFLEAKNIVTDEDGEIEVYVKAKENILTGTNFDEDASIELSSNSKTPFLKNYNLKVVPGPISSILSVSTGGILQHQDADTEEADFGTVILKLVDEFDNPVFSSVVNIKIENTDGSELSKAWRLSSVGHSDGLELSGTTEDNTDANLAGKFYFKVKLNGDKSKGAAKVTATTENGKIYEFSVSIVSGAVSKVKACCGEACSEDPEDCNAIIEAANPSVTFSGTGFKVKAFDKNNNPVDAGIPIYLKLMSGLNSPLDEFSCNDCKENTDINSYGPSLAMKETTSEYNVEFYSDRDNADTYEKISPYVTDADGIVNIVDLVAGKLKSDNDGYYGLRVSVNTAPVLTETETYVDFSNILVNPRAASDIRFNTASIEATDVDLVAEGVQWYKGKASVEDIKVEVVDRYGNIVESGSHELGLSAVDYASNETLQNSPSVGSLYIGVDASTKDLAVTESSVNGVANFVETSFKHGASSYYPMVVKLLVEAELGGVSKKKLIDVEILESVVYEVTNISYSYSGGIWSEGTFTEHATNPLASFGDTYSDVTATITIRNKGVITSPNELRITSNAGVTYSVDTSDCEGKLLESEETCDVLVTYLYGSGGSLGANDSLEIYVRDEGEELETSLITVVASGHRKVPGVLTLVSIDADVGKEAIAYGSVNYASDVESTLILKNSGEVEISNCTYPETPNKNSYLISLTPDFPMTYNDEKTLKYKFTTVDAELGLQSQSLGITCSLENGGTTNLSIAVSGTRLTNAIIAEAGDKTTWNFGTVTSGTPCEEFSIVNEGETAAGIVVPLNLSLVGATNFQIQAASSNDCSDAQYDILSGSSSETCKIKVCFTQSVAGTYSDTLRVVADLGNTVDISLSGVRTTPANLVIAADTTNNFGTVNVGSTSSPLLFTVTNSGGSTASINVAGSDALLNGIFNYTGSGFPGTNGTCISTLNAAATCKLEVVFSPIVAGSLTDDIEVLYNNGANNVSTTLGISGVGVAVSAYLWTKAVGGSGNDYGRAVRVDSLGNIYYCGFFQNTFDFDFTTGVDNKTSAGGYDIFISKINSDGTYAWTRTMGAGSTDYCIGMNIDSNNNIFITGTFTNTVDFDFTAGVDSKTSSSGTQDAFVTKINSDGSYGWTASFGSNIDDYSYGITSDASGNIYVTGYYKTTTTIDFDFSAGVDTKNGNSSYKQIYVMKINSNGTYGWTINIVGGLDCIGNDVRVDASNNIYLSGYYSGTLDFNFGAGTDNKTAIGSLDSFLMKINSDRTYAWAKTFGGVGIDSSQDIQFDSSGNIYTVGRFQNSVDFNVDAGTDNKTSAGAYDAYLIKLAADGTYSWVKTFGGVGDDFATALKIDSSNNIYLSGYFNNTVDFDVTAGVDSIVSKGLSDAFLMKLNSNLSYAWTKTYGSTGADGAQVSSIDIFNSYIFFTGYFSGTVDFDYTVGVDNKTSNGATDSFILGVSK